VLQQERDLDEIGNVVSDLGSMAVIMGDELDRQNTQLVKITGRVEEANERIHTNTNRVRMIG